MYITHVTHTEGIHTYICIYVFANPPATQIIAVILQLLLACRGTSALKYEFEFREFSVNT